MKNDSSRFTFDARKHFSSVRMQQGRVQIDADGNEQNDIVNYRVGTEARDVIGVCGAPMHYPAFHIVGALSQLNTEEKALPGNAVVPSGFKLPDFLISAGRYYVDGILCENETLTSYLNQPDLLKAPAITEQGLYLIYVDVWQRLLTALDDPSIREIALGGPDTATRTKTVWQVKHWLAVGPDGKKADGNCLTKFEVFGKLIAPSSGKLSARTKPPLASSDPCIVPPGAGYTGLENQFYRVEIHNGGDALDVSSGGAGTLATRVPNKNDQVKVSGSWQAGQAIEIFSSNASDDPLNGTLAYITKVEGTTKKTLTLGIDVSKIALDELRVRAVKATFKWSRDNGVVVTTIQSIKGQEVTVHDLGPDDALGFKIGQWVDISDDELELKGLPGQLAQITKIDSAINLITLNVAPAPLDATQSSGVNNDRHPKLRRWDGIGAVKFASGDHSLDLENGVQVRFFAGSLRTGDYWTTAARTATADAQSGNIEWPRDAASEPVPQLPFGIKHHYCRLAMLHWAGADKGFDVIEDCRNLFPPITELTTLSYVNGAGQESMPNHPQPQPLQAGVFNGRWAVPGARVQFTASDNGQLASNISGLPASMPAGTKTLIVNTGADGVASCAWTLDPDVNKPSQVVEARLLDANGDPLPPVVRFDGNLSLASQVFYDPSKCAELKADKVTNVQDAIDHLCELHEGGGCDVTVGKGGQFEQLEEAIKKLLGDKQTDICICLLAGDHEVKDGLTIEGKDLNVKIVGCGRGSRLIFPPNEAGNSFKAVGLGGLILRDLMMFGKNFSIGLDQCEDITIAGCYLIQDQQASPFIRVGGAKRVRFEGNVISATLRTTEDRPSLGATPGVAIVLNDGDAETWIEDNHIAGVVSLYGAPGTAKLTQDDLRKLSEALKKGDVTFADPVASLHVRDNVMYRINASAEMVKLLKGVTLNKGAKLEHTYRRCLVTNNAFSGGDNVFVMDHLALTSNSFEREAKLDVGSVIANTAVYLGNHAPDDIRLFSVVGDKAKAANLKINIVDL